MAASSDAVTDVSWRGFPAWHIRGDELECIVMKTGAHLASLVLSSDASQVNPLWQPIWPHGSPSAALLCDTWGVGPEAALLTGICGSNLCIDRFGPAHPSDAARPLHGEAGVLVWSQVPASLGSVASFTADLPLAGLRVTRTFALSGHELSLTTRAERLSGADDAPVEWW